ncbi:MAG TPA: DUF3859 domain-containing protein [Gammaproteobacteria bacterium]|nr:DUF3859 domain-containing protein [Gammaproteobacteria bacterium]
MNRLTVLACLLALAACKPVADDEGAATGRNEAVAPGRAAASTADNGVAVRTAIEGPRAHVFQFGLYKASRKGQVKESPGTNTGKIVRKPKLEHVSMTNRVPLVKDTYFGYQYRVFKLPPEITTRPFVELRKVLIHPQMTLPDGSTTSGWDRPFKGRIEVGQVMGFDGYAFNEDYELVEGDWIFQIWYEDKKLIEQKFTAFRPDPGQTARLGNEE